MKRAYEVTLKRMLDGKPDCHQVMVEANGGVQAVLLASRELRRDGITDCIWTPTRVKAVKS